MRVIVFDGSDFAHDYHDHLGFCIVHPSPYPLSCPCLVVVIAISFRQTASNIL